MILVVIMNFYIRSYASDEYYTEEYMEFSKKVCIGCMIAYNYGDYVYLNNNIDTPKEHHNIFIWNKKTDFYITSLSKLMDGTFTSLPKLFVDEMIKKDELPCQSCGSVIKFLKYNRENQKIEPMFIAREEWMNILSYVDCCFSKLCHVIKYFTELNKKIGKKMLLSLSPQRQEPLNGKINILLNYNHMWIKSIQACSMNSQSIKYILRAPSFLIWEMTRDIHIMNYPENNIYILGKSSFPCVLSHMPDIVQYIEDNYTISLLVYRI